MPSVKVRDNEPFDVALRRFKRSCEKAGVLSEVRRREHYEKPTAERKRKAAAAVNVTPRSCSVSVSVSNGSIDPYLERARAVGWLSQEGCQAAATRWPFVFRSVMCVLRGLR